MIARCGKGGADNTSGVAGYIVRISKITNVFMLAMQLDYYTVS